MNVQAYVFFDGKCEEALEFYKAAVGAKVDMVMRFKEAPPEMQSQMSPGSKDKIMHAAFRVGDTQILASDGECHGKPKFDGFSLTLNAANDAEADRLFSALGKGGKVTQPMSETFFASRFGMLSDKFGVNWMVLAEKKAA
jgi:PhnB protein